MNKKVTKTEFTKALREATNGEAEGLNFFTEFDKTKPEANRFMSSKEGAGSDPGRKVKQIRYYRSFVALAACFIVVFVSTVVLGGPDIIKIISDQSSYETGMGGGSAESTSQETTGAAEDNTAKDDLEDALALSPSKNSEEDSESSADINSDISGSADAGGSADVLAPSIEVEVSDTEPDLTTDEDQYSKGIADESDAEERESEDNSSDELLLTVKIASILCGLFLLAMLLLSKKIGIGRAGALYRVVPLRIITAIIGLAAVIIGLIFLIIP